MLTTSTLNRIMVVELPRCQHPRVPCHDPSRRTTGAPLIAVLMGRHDYQRNADLVLVAYRSPGYHAGSGPLLARTERIGFGLLYDRCEPALLNLIACFACYTSH